MSKLIRKSNKGFTLIELMIVVAIIGILAAIAIPNFMRFQLKSKSSEGKVNIAAIRTAQESYLAEFGSYVPAAASPLAFPGVSKQLYANVAGPNSGFDQLGWSPEGRVFFQYEAAATLGSSYTITARADIDGDGVPQVWGYVKPNNLGLGETTTMGACTTAGVASPDPAIRLFSTVGPCVTSHGQSVF
jgi:type IV pilus assembly protein PilA